MCLAPYLYTGSGDGSLNQMTNNSGLSGDGGVVSQGSIACLPNSPSTFLIGTVGIVCVPASCFFSFSWGDWIGIAGKTGKAHGTADKNAFDWDEEEDEMGGESINRAAARKKKRKLEKFR